MEKPTPSEYHVNYQKYMDLVPEGDCQKLLRQNSTTIIEFFNAVPDSRHDYRYAPGKWTIKEVLMHIIDTERVFSFRALAAARGDQTPMYRMDEELYARNVDLGQRKLQDVLAEFQTVRMATESLFENLTDAQSLQTCNIINHPMTLRAIGFFIVGHAEHHRKIVTERYL